MDDKTYEDRVIKITDLVGDDGLLDGFTFIGCHIKGPAVIWLAGSTLSNNVLSDTADAVLWDILPGRQRITGAVIAKGCTFERCTFVNIGLSAPPMTFARCESLVRTIPCLRSTASSRSEPTPLSRATRLTLKPLWSVDLPTGMHFPLQRRSQQDCGCWGTPREQGQRVRHTLAQGAPNCLPPCKGNPRFLIPLQRRDSYH